MTCSECTKLGSKCATCEMRERGFVEKTYVDDLVKGINAQSGKSDTQSEHVHGDIDALFSHSDNCPNPDTCKISKALNGLKEMYYNMGFQSGSQ